MLVILIGKNNAIFPLFQSSSFAILSENQRSEEIVALAYVLVPHGNYERLLVEIVWSRLEEKLFIKDWIEITPFCARLKLPLMRVRTKLSKT